MSAARRPHLGRWGDDSRVGHDDHVVVFIHGILSDSSTFDRLLPLLAEGRPVEFDFWLFDYDFNQPLVTSAEQLADEIQARSFGTRRIDIVGHSMGGLIARLAVLRRSLPQVSRIVTLATPNHGTVNGTQLNILGQMTTLGLRRLHPLRPRAAGILELTDANGSMRRALEEMAATQPGRLHGKTYVSIPGQYFHTKRQIGSIPPSLLMGGFSVVRFLLGLIMRLHLRPVHDGIVEERSNQLHPAPTGSTSEAAHMSRADATTRLLHVTHEAAADLDHVTVTSSREIADLLRAVLLAPTLDEDGIDPFLSGRIGSVSIRPQVP